MRPGNATADPRSKFQHVPVTSALLYGAGNAPITMVGTALSLYFYFFYTDTLGLAPLYLSAVMFAGSLWDAVSDQIMGQISDRTHWARGRRRPYLLIGAVPVGLFFYLILAPPRSLEGVHLFVYVFVVRILLFTATTVVAVPLYALVPEMAQTYHGRTRLTAFREACSNIGDLLGMIAPLLFLMYFTKSMGDGPEAQRRAYAAVGLFGAAVAVVALAASYAGAYEDPDFRRTTTVDWRAGLHAMRTNQAFRTLILSALFPAMAVQIVAGLFLYVITHVLRVEDEMFTGLAFLAYVGAALVSYPMWLHLARRFGKAGAYRIACLLMAAAYAGVYALHEGTLGRLFPIMMAAGAGSAGFWMTLFAQLADIADLDELDSGARREGLFAGFASLMRKIGYALGGGAIGVGLWLVQYDGALDVQSAGTVFGLKVIFSVPTGIFVLVGAYIHRSYPLTEARHAEVMRQLDARRAVSQSGS